jgi:hypothetical protein
MTTANPPNRIDLLQHIIETGTAMEIEDVIVDPITAQAVLLVHNTLTETHRAQFAAMSLETAAALAHRLVAKFVTGDSL